MLLFFTPSRFVTRRVTNVRPRTSRSAVDAELVAGTGRRPATIGRWNVRRQPTPRRAACFWPGTRTATRRSDVPPRSARCGQRLRSDHSGRRLRVLPQPGRRRAVPRRGQLGTCTSPSQAVVHRRQPRRSRRTRRSSPSHGARGDPTERLLPAAGQPCPVREPCLRVPRGCVLGRLARPHRGNSLRRATPPMPSTQAAGERRRYGSPRFTPSPMRGARAACRRRRSSHRTSPC